MTQQEYINDTRNIYGRNLLSKKETAIELGGISIATLDRIRQAGDIKSTKVSGQIMFKSIDIYTYLFCR